MLELRACYERSVSATGVIATDFIHVPVSDYSAAYVGNNLSESHRTLGDNFMVTPRGYESFRNVKSCVVELSARHPRELTRMSLFHTTIESLFQYSIIVSLVEFNCVEFYMFLTSD